METEEQMVRRLGSTWTQKFGWEYDPDIEAELSRILSEEIDKEMVKSLKRMVNNVPTVSDRIKPIK